MKIKFIFTFLLVIAITGCTQVSSKKENLSFNKIPEAINLNILDKEGLVVLNKQKLPLDTNGIIKEIRIDLPDYSQGVFFRPFSYTAASGNRLEPVYFRNLSDLVHFKKTVPKEGDSMQMGTFLLLKKPNGTYFVVLPIVSNQIGNTLKVDKNSFYLECATYGTHRVSCVAPLFAYAESKNPYEAAHLAWDKAKNAPNVKGNVNWRSDKTFPEPYTYLGWCSWEHFRTNINEATLLNAISDIKSSKIPFRWVLIDDGYLDQTDHKLLSFGVDKKKFPNGWDPITKQKDDKIKWLGIWRNFNGYMRGISKNHTMTNLTKDITEVKSSKDSKYMSKTTEESANAFYNEMTAQTKDSGFDIIKVDFQSNNLAFNRGTENPVLGVHYNNRALEENCKAKKLSLLNCIAMQNFNVFNQTYSDLIRGSIDYKTTINRIDLSIVQNFMNAFWLGHTHWIDQDMFHTSYKETARLMARCRALSGGPIYLSDATKYIDDEYIKPLIYEDGKIVGTLAPGVPLPESLLNDPYKAKKAFKVIAPLENKTASLMAINLNRSGTITTSLSKNDYTYAGGMIQPYEGLWKLPKEGLLLYDYSLKKAQVFVQDYEFKLNTREERLFQLSPIHNGWSVIGRPDKFLSAQTFKLIYATPNKIEIQMKENGPLLLWCNHKIPVSTNYTFKQTGDNLWYGTLNKPTKSKHYSISIKK